MSTLVLSPSYQPVSYLPLSTVSWQTSLRLFFLAKVTVLDWYDDWIVNSTSISMRVPAVIVTKNGFKNYSKYQCRFSRSNLYLRDLFTCQYCLDTFESRELTIDHVVPVSKGGSTNWTNCVASCYSCNSKKGSDNWKPAKEPTVPDYWRLVNGAKQCNINVKHPSWHKYLNLKSTKPVAS